MGLMDTQMAAVVTNSLSSSNVTLSYANVQSCMFRFTGTLLASVVISPDTGGSPIADTYCRGFYYFENLTTGSFTVTFTTSIGSVVLPQGRRGTLFVDGTNGPRIVAIAGSSTADPLPGNGTTKMTFDMAAPPAGWTQITSYNNYAMRLVSGTGAGTGGSTGFTSVFASRTPAGINSTSSVTIPRDGWGQAIYSFVSGRLVTTTNNAAFQQATADQTATVSAQTFTGSAMDFAVQYVDLILASRD